MLTEIDLSVDDILKWIRKKCMVSMARDLRFANSIKQGSISEPDHKQSQSQPTSVNLDMSNLVSTVKSAESTRYISRQLEQFVKNIQLNHKLIHFLIRTSIDSKNKQLKDKSLESLLDIFSIGSHIEQYLVGLILVKDGEEALYYEKIANASSLLKN